MGFLTTTVLFFLVLGLLVIVHELGHFAAAKLSKVRVDEFGIGFPPRLLSVVFRGTRYSINIIPIGGFVRIKGIAGERPDAEESTENTGDQDAELTEQKKDSAQDGDSFAAQPKWKRFSILFAGIGMNILTAWVLFTATFLIGIRVPVIAENVSQADAHTEVVIVGIVPDTPAGEAGIQIGDVLVSADNQPVPSIEVLRKLTDEAHSEGRELELMIDRGGETISQHVPITTVESEGEQYTGIGVSLSEVQTVQHGFFQALYAGLQQTAVGLLGILLGFWQLISQAFQGEGSFEGLAGPVGIAQITSQAYQFGIAQLFQLMGLLSLNLAIFNLLPIPGLDGGRIAVLMIETVRRKPIAENTEALIHSIGFILLISLIVLVTYKDILRIIGS